MMGSDYHRWKISLASQRLHFNKPADVGVYHESQYTCAYADLGKRVQKYPEVTISYFRGLLHKLTRHSRFCMLRVDACLTPQAVQLPLVSNIIFLLLINFS